MKFSRLELKSEAKVTNLRSSKVQNQHTYDCTYIYAVGEPSFGIAGPFAIGLSLLVGIQAAGKFTGQNDLLHFPFVVAGRSTLSQHSRIAGGQGCIRREPFHP